jgi:hypothetical protein
MTGNRKLTAGAQAGRAMQRARFFGQPVTQPGMGAGIARLLDLSMTGVIELARLFILLSPIVAGAAQLL